MIIPISVKNKSVKGIQVLFLSLIILNLSYSFLANNGILQNNSEKLESVGWSHRDDRILKSSFPKIIPWPNPHLIRKSPDLYYPKTVTVKAGKTSINSSEAITFEAKYPEQNIRVNSEERYNKISWLERGSEGLLVFYRWDLNNDGNWDRLGKTVTHKFENYSTGTTEKVKLQAVGYKPSAIYTKVSTPSYDLKNPLVDIGPNSDITAFNSDMETLANGSTSISIKMKLPPKTRFNFYKIGDKKFKFNASSSYDPDTGKIVNYTWKWGDGETDITTGPIISHNYSSKGDYTVSLTTEDKTGNINKKSKLVEVGEQSYTISFSETGLNYFSVPYSGINKSWIENKCGFNFTNSTPYRYSAMQFEQAEEFIYHQGYIAAVDADCNLNFNHEPSDYLSNSSLGISTARLWNLISVGRKRTWNDINGDCKIYHNIKKPPSNADVGKNKQLEGSKAYWISPTEECFRYLR